MSSFINSVFPKNELSLLNLLPPLFQSVSESSKNELRQVCTRMNQMILIARQSIIFDDEQFKMAEQDNQKRQLGRRIDYCKIAEDSLLLKNLILRKPPTSNNFFKFLNTYEKRIKSIDFTFEHGHNKFQFEKLASDYLTSFTFRKNTIGLNLHELSDALNQITNRSSNLISLTFHEQNNSLAIKRIPLAHLPGLTYLDIKTSYIDSQVLEEVIHCQALKTLNLEMMHSDDFYTYEDDPTTDTGRDDWQSFLINQKLPLEKLSLIGCRAHFTDIQLNQVITNLTSNLHTFECSGVTRFTDAHLLLLAKRCELISVFLHCAYVTDNGLEEFLKNAMQLKKFEGIAMHKISSLLPFVNFSKQIQEIRTDGYPTDSKNLSELSKLQSLKTLFLNVSFKDKELKNTVKYLNSLVSV